MISLALYQPEIPQNTGTLIRLSACLGITLHIIEPCGFIFDDNRLKRAGLDYFDLQTLKRYIHWDHFVESNKDCRIILLDTKSHTHYLEFKFQKNDILLLGKESTGVPDFLFHKLDYKVKISMQHGCRSLNVAIAAAMVAGEGLRQLKYQCF